MARQLARLRIRRLIAGLGRRVHELLRPDGGDDALAQTRRDLDALHIRIAGAIAHRSAPELGRDGMAKQQGYRNAAALIAAATGGSGAEAARLICVGVATAERSSFSGQRMAPRHPHVAEAMKGGCLSLDSAAVITEMLDRVAPRADHEESMKAERTLARRAPSLSLEQVRRLVKHAEAKLDTDGVPEREDALATASWSRIRQEASGSVLFSARLDPVNGACLKTTVETLVTAEIRRARDVDLGSGSHPSRSIPALQADALGLIARHSLSCRETVAPLDLATIIVRCTLDDLRSGSGAAMIDGIDQPISIGTVRRLAVFHPSAPHRPGAGSSARRPGAVRLRDRRAQLIGPPPASVRRFSRENRSGARRVGRGAVEPERVARIAMVAATVAIFRPRSSLLASRIRSPFRPEPDPAYRRWHVPEHPMPS